MARIEGEIVIDRPADAVFDFVADERNEPLVARMGRRHEQTIWASLKRVLEAQGSAPVGSR